MADYKKYVDKYGDLASAWKEIESGKGKDADYWKGRGATSKEAFGKLHFAESGKTEGRSLSTSSRSRSPAPRS